MPDMFKIVWSEIAISDLDSILDYIAYEDSVESAQNVYAKIELKVNSLAQSPCRCRVVPELQEIGVSEFRENLWGPYRICFRIYHQTVVLVAIVDSRRNLEEFLVERSLLFT
ncbi:MAG: type II toxin-antitoxin system RelE/ParE family toxin [bacterium]